MNPALVFLGVAVAAVGAGIAVSTMRRSWLTPNDRIWIIGDSLGVGLLPRFIELGQADQIAVEGNPVGGTIIRQWAKKDLSEIQTWGATAVLVVLGSNDAAASQDYVHNRAQGYARDLVAKLKTMGLKIWWLAPGETGALAHSVEIRSMIEHLGFIEGIMVRSVPDDIPYSKFDYIHPTPDGYKKLATWTWSEWTRK